MRKKTMVSNAAMGSCSPRGIISLPFYSFLSIGHPRRPVIIAPSQLKLGCVSYLLVMTNRSYAFDVHDIVFRMFSVNGTKESLLYKKHSL